MTRRRESGYYVHGAGEPSAGGRVIRQVFLLAFVAFALACSGSKSPVSVVDDGTDGLSAAASLSVGAGPDRPLLVHFTVQNSSTVVRRVTVLAMAPVLTEVFAAGDSSVVVASPDTSAVRSGQLIEIPAGSSVTLVRSIPRAFFGTLPDGEYWIRAYLSAGPSRPLRANAGSFQLPFVDLR